MEANRLSGPRDGLPQPAGPLPSIGSGLVFVALKSEGSEQRCKPHRMLALRRVVANTSGAVTIHRASRPSHGCSGA